MGWWRLGLALTFGAWSAAPTVLRAQETPPASPAPAEATPVPPAPGAELAAPAADHGEIERLPHDARLMVPVCSTLPFDQSALVRQVDVALAAIGVRLVLRGIVDPVDGGHAVIAIELEECSADVARAFIVLTHDPSGMRTRAEVDLRDASVAERSRILAITAASLLAEEWVALSVARLGNPYAEEGPEPSPPPLNPYGGEAFEPGTPAANPYRGRLRSISREREAIREEARRTMEALRESESRGPRSSVDAGLTFRTLPGRTGGLLGADAGATKRIVPHLRIAAGLSAVAGITPDEFEDVGVGQILAFATLYGGSESRSVWSGIGPSFEIGWGTVSSPFGSAHGLTGNVLVRATLRSHVARRVWLRADAFFGYVYATVTTFTDSGNRVGLIGPTIGISAGVSVSP